MLEKIKRDRKEIIMILTACLSWGILAHGFMLFHKLSYHDDQVAMFNVGTTIVNGRWMLEILSKFNNIVCGGGDFSIPAFLGLETFFVIAVAAYILIHVFQIGYTVSKIAICGVMITIPVVTALLGYMFTAPYYMFGMFLATVGGCIAIRYETLPGTCGGKQVAWNVAAIILFACATGMYQAYFPFAASMLLLSLIKESIYTKHGLQWYVLTIVRYLILLMSSLLLWLFITKVAQKLYAVNMTDYAEFDQIGHISFVLYMKRILLSYKFFFIPMEGARHNVYPMTTKVVLWILFFWIFMLSVRIGIRLWKQRRGVDFFMFLLELAVFPLVVNFIFVLSGEGWIHTLMMYPQIFIAVLFLIELEEMQNSGALLRAIAYRSGVGMLLVLALMYARYSNICYLSDEFFQTQAIGYFNTLITRIKSTEGYTDELPVAYINERQIYDESISRIPQFEMVNATIPYANHLRTYLNDYGWKTFMANWCGYSPATCSSSVFDENEIVAGMPSYPDDGSVKVVDGVVVVKFGK